MSFTRLIAISLRWTIARRAAETVLYEMADIAAAVMRPVGVKGEYEVWRGVVDYHVIRNSSVGETDELVVMLMVAEAVACLFGIRRHLVQVDDELLIFLNGVCPPAADAHDVVCETERLVLLECSRKFVAVFLVYIVRTDDIKTGIACSFPYAS